MSEAERGCDKVGRPHHLCASVKGLLCGLISILSFLPVSWLLNEVGFGDRKSPTGSRFVLLPLFFVFKILRMSSCK